MQPLEKQILNLSHKVDAIYRLIEGLETKFDRALSECTLEKTYPQDQYQENSQAKRYQLTGYTNSQPKLEHKDILTDGMYLDINRQTGDHQITPEIQIQRLTAQLTAAYNRIAALEEQLMKERIH
jgi:hypothetical protein